MNKVAILFIGRINNYKNTYSLFFKNFINNNKNIVFDIYIATWKLTDFEKKDLEDIYNPKQILEYKLDDYNKFLKLNDLFSLSNINTESKINIHKIKPAGTDVFLFQYFFLYNGLNEIKKKNHYDIIIKNRFDLLFEEPFTMSLPINDNEIICPKLLCYSGTKNTNMYKEKKGNGIYRIHDPFYYGNCQSIYILFNILNILTNLKKYEKKVPCVFKAVKMGKSETVIAYNFMINSIKINTIDLKLKIFRNINYYN